MGTGCGAGSAARALSKPRNWRAIAMESVSGAGGRPGALWSRRPPARSRGGPGQAWCWSPEPPSSASAGAPTGPPPRRPGVRGTLAEPAVSLERTNAALLLASCLPMRASSSFRSLHVSPACRELQDPVCATVYCSSWHRRLKDCIAANPEATLLQ